MRTVVLSDNRSINPNFETEHGLSIYLETEYHKFLLDTGSSDLFIRNSEKMNIDLSDVDYVFISHGHADHMGGLSAFLKINKKAKVLLSAQIPNRQYFSKRTGLKDISILFNFEDYRDRLILIEDNYNINTDFYVLKNTSIKYKKPKANNSLYIANLLGELELDNFNHELIFVAGKERKFIYTGCAHNGLLNILETVNLQYCETIQWVMGGFHLLDKKYDNTYETTDELQIIAEHICSKYPQTEFITGHCTGDNAFNTLKKTLGLRLLNFYTGYKTAN